MRAISFLAFVLILASPTFAQKAGFFVNAGGGIARLEAATFSVYNPLASTPGGEPLEANDRKSTVSVARVTVGYNFNENWAVQLAYASYGTGEIGVSFPVYPGYVWATGAGPDTYHRHVLRYKPTTVTLMPVYTYAIDAKSRAIVGAGGSYGTTSSHFEITSIPGGTVSPALLVPQSASYAEETDHSLGLVATLGFDHLITESISVQLSANYTGMKATVPSSPWATRSKSSVRITALSAELSVAKHW